MALPVYFFLGIGEPCGCGFGYHLRSGHDAGSGGSAGIRAFVAILLSQGMEGKALFIFLYGLIVMGSVDNIARMWVLKKIGSTHPLVTLFGAIAGVKLFGFVGFIFGPILISMAILLFRIYQKELENRRTVQPDADTPDTPNVTAKKS